MAERAGSKSKAVPSLADTEAIATVGVKDLNRARRFYEDTLGLKPASAEGDESINYTTGDAQLMVYRSDCAGTNEATAVTWNVEDVDGLAAELKSRGVPFERYDMPDAEHEGDVHVFGEMRAAWFKDPDGNVMAIFSR